MTRRTLPGCSGARTLLLTVALLAGATVLGVAPARAAHTRGPVAAPAFSLPASHGTASLDSLRGKVVLVDFWASWCEPCRKSFPWLKAVQDRYGARGFTVVAIDLDKRRDDAEAFLARFDTPFAVAFDPAGRTAEAFKVSAMPSSFLIDRTGGIVYSHAGFDPGQTAAFEARIEEACSR